MRPNIATEELVVRKAAEERTEVVSVTVHRTEAEVDDERQTGKATPASTPGTAKRDVGEV